MYGLTVSNRSKLAILCSIIGVLFCLGWSLLFHQYILFWFPSIITVVLIIIGIILIMESKALGFNLCVVAGIVAFIFSLGALIGLGGLLLLHSYNYFWLQCLIATVIIIIGIVIGKNRRTTGLIFCFLGGIIFLILAIIYGWIYLYTTFLFLFFFNIWGPMLLIVGGIIGYQELKPATLPKHSPIGQKEVETLNTIQPIGLDHQEDCPKCYLSRKIRLEKCSWCGKRL